MGYVGHKIRFQRLHAFQLQGHLVDSFYNFIIFMNPVLHMKGNLGAEAALEILSTVSHNGTNGYFHGKFSADAVNQAHQQAHKQQVHNNIPRHSFILQIVAVGLHRAGVQRQIRRTDKHGQGKKISDTGAGKKAAPFLPSAGCSFPCPILLSFILLLLVPAPL